MIAQLQYEPLNLVMRAISSCIVLYYRMSTQTSKMRTKPKIRRWSHTRNNQVRFI